MIKIVVDSVLPHTVCGQNDHQKDAPPFSKFVKKREYIIHLEIDDDSIVNLRKKVNGSSVNS